MPDKIDLQVIDEKVTKMTDFVAESFEKVQAKQATIDEELEKFRGHIGEVQKEIEKQRLALPSNAPLDKQTGEALATKGRFQSLGLKKALHLPTTHEAYASEDDRAEASELQKQHDLCVLLFHLYYQRSGKNIRAAGERLSRTKSWYRYAKVRERLGFGAADDLKTKLLSGDLIHYRTANDTEIEVIEKADEIMSPDAAAQSVLDFAVTSGTLIERIRLRLRIAAAFDPITLVRSTQNVPAMTNDALGVWGGGTQHKIPQRDIPAPPHVLPPATAPNFYSNLNFNSVTFDAKHVLCFLPVNDDMEEDAVIAFRAKLMQQVEYGAARAIDRAIMNGDTAATHRDLDVTASNDLAKAWNGLRKMSALNQLPNSAGQFDVDDLHALRVSLGTYGEDPAMLVNFLALRDLYRMIGAASGSGDLLRRVDTIGERRATLITGTLAEAYGIPIAPSEFCKTDLDNTGIRPASPGTKSAPVLCHRGRFAMATFGIARVESWRIPPELYTIIQYDARVDFGRWDEHALDGSGRFSVGADIPVNTMIDCS